MNRSTLRENAALAAISGPAGSMNLIVPLYLSHLGHPLPVIGLMLALTSVSTLFSRLPVAALYRPERARLVLIISLLVGAITFAALPAMPELVSFSVVMIINRVAFGLATTFFLARFLDLQEAGTDRRRAMGYYSGTQALGYTTSNLLIGALADFVNYTAAWLYGTVFAVLAVLLLVRAQDPAPRSTIAAGRVAPGDRPRGVRGWLHSLADPGLVSVLNGAAVNTVLHNVLVAFFPIYAVGIGLGATQIGLARSLYSGINMIARPIAGIVMGRLSVRHVTYLGLGAQGLLVGMIPFATSFPLFLAVFAIAAAGRAVVIVSNSVALVEEVDDSRVSRGVATAAFSAAPDVASISSPILAGVIASAVTVGPMFGIMALGSLLSYATVEVVVARWRAARAARMAGFPGARAP